MSGVKLSTAEKKWLAALEAVLECAPKSLRKKGVRCYTTGCDRLTIYDGEKCDRYVDTRTGFHNTDVCTDVVHSKSELLCIYFPVVVESTAG